MHISRVKKTKLTPYLPNKHTLAEVVITYTCSGELGFPVIITVEDFKTVEDAFIQGILDDHLVYGCSYSIVEGNKIAIGQVSGVWEHVDGLKIHILAFGTR